MRYESDQPQCRKYKTLIDFYITLTLEIQFGVKYLGFVEVPRLGHFLFFMLKIKICKLMGDFSSPTKVNICISEKLTS